MSTLLSRLRPILCVLFCACWGFTDAQHAVSLKESIALAMQHFSALHSARLDVQMQREKNKIYIADAMPTITYAGQANYNIRIPSMFVPDFVSPSVTQVLAAQGVRNGLGQPIHTVPFDPTRGFFASFNLKWNMQHNVTLKQIIFDPGVMIAIQSTQKLMELAERKVDVVEDQVKENVIKLYFALLILQQRVEIAQQTLNRAQDLHQETKHLVENGLRDNLDLDRTTMNVSAARSGYEQLSHAQANVMANFKQILRIPNDEEVQLSTALQPAYYEVPSTSLLSETTTDVHARSDIKAMQMSLDLQKLDLQHKRLSYLPRLAAIGNFGYQSFANDIATLGKNTFPNHYVGVNLQLDIFGGMRKLHALRMAKMEMEKTQQEFNNSLELAGVAQQTAHRNYLSALSALAVSTENKKLSERVYAQMQARYRQGVSSSFEMINIQNEHNAVLDRWYQAVLSVLNARVDWKKELGDLDHVLE